VKLYYIVLIFLANQTHHSVAWVNLDSFETKNCDNWE